MNSTMEVLEEFYSVVHQIERTDSHAECRVFIELLYKVKELSDELIGIYS